MIFLTNQVHYILVGKWKGPMGAWKRRGIPFLGLCRLRGREIVDCVDVWATS
jgi:hypothetical protein